MNNLIKQFYTFLIFGCFIVIGNAQYTETINTNKPGNSMGAFAVGKGVIQIESAGHYGSWKHSRLNQSTVKGWGADLSVRYGIFFEQLELVGTAFYQFDEIENHLISPPKTSSRKGFRALEIGAKYLVFDPFRNTEKYKPSIRSWKANQGIKWRDLIPAVSVYAAAGFHPDNPYPYGDFFGSLKTIGLQPIAEPVMSPKASLITQNHFLGRWVFVTNTSYDRIGTDHPILSYAMTLTHNLKNPRWSVYIENEGIDSEVHADLLFRLGGAFLLNKNTQLDFSVGGSSKDSPAQYFGVLGLAYRIDRHRQGDIPQDRKIQRKLKRENRVEKKLGKAGRKADKKLKKAERKVKKAEKKAAKKLKKNGEG